MTAERISEWSRKLGGDGHIALYYTPGARRPWKAVTTIAKPKARGRYLESPPGLSAADALDALLRVMPPVPVR